MGIPNFNSYSGENGSTVSFSRAGVTLDIDGYSRIIQNQNIYDYNMKNVLLGKEISYKVENNLTDMTILATDESGNKDSVKINCMDLFENLIKEFGEGGMHHVPQQRMNITAESGKLKVKVYFNEIELMKSSDKTTVKRFSFDLLYIID